MDWHETAAAWNEDVRAQGQPSWTACRRVFIARWGASVYVRFGIFGASAAVRDSPFKRTPASGMRQLSRGE